MAMFNLIFVGSMACLIRFYVGSMALSKSKLIYCYEKLLFLQKFFRSRSGQKIGQVTVFWGVGHGHGQVMRKFLGAWSGHRSGQTKIWDRSVSESGQADFLKVEVSHWSGQMPKPRSFTTLVGTLIS